MSNVVRMLINRHHFIFFYIGLAWKYLTFGKYQMKTAEQRIEESDKHGDNDIDGRFIFGDNSLQHYSTYNIFFSLVHRARHTS